MAQKKSSSEEEASAPAAIEQDRRTIEGWTEEAGHPHGAPAYWKFAAAAAFKGWSRDELVTKRQLEDAMRDEMKQVTR
jgi:hypothetical protein